MVDLVDAILKGIDLHSFFYSKYGPVKYRPLTNLETRDVLNRTCKRLSPEAKSIVKHMRFRIIPEISVTKDALEEASSVYYDISLWICYHALKDFQREEWQHVDGSGIPLGVKILEHPDSYFEIEKLASAVLKLSVYGKERMASQIETENGKILAKAYWNLNVPLAELGKHTKLQLTFIHESHKYLKDTKNEYSSMEELMKGIGMTPLKPMSEEEVDMVQKWEEIRQNVHRRNKRVPES